MTDGEDLTERDDQRADYAQEEVAQEAPAGLATQANIGGARAAQPEVMGEIRQRRGQGRRVTLARQRSGGYAIWMRDRHVQSFCGEWEDITRFQLPEGIEQQVRIHIEPMGEARMLRPEYSGESDDRVEAAQPDDGVELRSIAHPNNPLVTNDLLGMFNALPPHNQAIIADQIRANYEESTRPIGYDEDRPTQATRDELRQRILQEQQLRRTPVPPVPEGGDVWDHILGLLHDEVQRVHQLIGTVETMRQR